MKLIALILLICTMLLINARLGDTQVEIKVSEKSGKWWF